MPKYEIMLIVDPNQLNEAEKISKEVFGDKISNYQKLDRTDLAYEINKTKVANYFLINVETDGSTIREFVRRANISKAIWRHMILNLETERAIKTLDKMIPLSEIRDERRERGGYNRDNRPRYNRYNNDSRSNQQHTQRPQQQQQQQPQSATDQKPNTN